MLVERLPHRKVEMVRNSPSLHQHPPIHYKCSSLAGIRLPSKWLSLILDLRQEQEK
jgi:hypothetical protein